jgi:hypothetical protein
VAANFSTRSARSGLASFDSALARLFSTLKNPFFYSRWRCLKGKEASRGRRRREGSTDMSFLPRLLHRPASPPPCQMAHRSASSNGVPGSGRGGRAGAAQGREGAQDRRAPPPSSTPPAARPASSPASSTPEHVAVASDQTQRGKTRTCAPPAHSSLPSPPPLPPSPSSPSLPPSLPPPSLCLPVSCFFPLLICSDVRLCARNRSAGRLGRGRAGRGPL